MILLTFSTKAADAEETQKISFSLGASYITNEGFDALKGTSRTVDDEDGANIFQISYNISQNFALEAGVLSESQITSSMPVGSSGTLHGKSYSVSQGCSHCVTNEGSGTINLKAEIDSSYLFGIKYSTSLNRSLNAYTSLGILYWDVDYYASNAQLVYNGTAKSGRFLEVSGNDAYMGLGATYDINKNSSISIDYLVSKIHDSRIRSTSLVWKQSF